MGISVDFTDTGEGFSAVPPDTYEAQITSIEVKDSKDKQSQNLQWQFTIIEGEYIDRVLFLWKNLKPQALWSLRELLVDLGVPREDVEGEFEFEPDDFIGMNVYMTVQVGMYQGKETNEIVRVVAKPDKPGAAKGKKTTKKSGGRSRVR